MKSIFPLTGDFYELPMGSGDRLVTVTSPTALVGSFNLTSIASSEAVDYSIQKTLEQTHTLASFGDTPVSIKLAGIQVLKQGSCSASNALKDVTKWYNRAKLSAPTRELLSINITGTVYRGYVVNLTCNPTSGESVKAMVYNLTVIAGRSDL